MVDGQLRAARAANDRTLQQIIGRVLRAEPTTRRPTPAARWRWRGRAGARRSCVRVMPSTGRRAFRVGELPVALVLIADPDRRAAPSDATLRSLGSRRARRVSRSDWCRAARWPKPRATSAWRTTPRAPICAASSPRRGRARRSSWCACWSSSPGSTAPNDGKLDGKVAVVTGGSAGIGLAIARRFVAEGATVFITGRRQAALDAAVEAIGPQATGVRGDSANLGDLDRLYQTVHDKAGRLDVVVANAGFGEAAPLGAINEEHCEKSFTANVKGPLFAVQKALPLMQDGGAIVLIGSIITVRPVPGFTAYAASKAAIRSFARQWMLELAPRRIRVNAISPGPIETPGLDSLTATEEERRQFKADLAGQVPLGRLGEPDEVAKAAVFLASDDASFVNGVELFVDGGLAQS